MVSEFIEPQPKTSVVDYQILSRDEAIRFQRIKE